MREHFPLTRMPYVLAHGADPIVELHYHDYLEVGYCYEGAGVFAIEDKVYTYKAGDVVVIPPPQSHAARSLPGSTIKGMYFWTDPERFLKVIADDPETLDTRPFTSPAFSHVLHGDEHPAIADLVRQIMAELLEMKPGFRSLVRGGVLSLMARLHRLEGVGTHPAETSPEYERIVPALHHIAGHYSEDMTVGKLAALCHLSERQFRRVFQVAIGYSASQYLAAMRIRMAISMLESTTRSITEIAMAVGYNSLCTFNRNFQMIAGMSPRQRRKRSKELRLPDPPRPPQPGECPRDLAVRDVPAD